MPPVIGLDFGTTNSAIAVADAAREATLASFADGATNSFRSILYFPAKDRSSTTKPETKAGPEAISSYLDADTKGRLILSIKSYLASDLFTSTHINGRYYTLEDLIAIILRRLRTRVIEQFGISANSVVLGRPVRFAGADTKADETLALNRLRSAAELAGFSEVTFELEPVAAAYPVPVWLYSQLSSWHRTFLLKDPKTMTVLREVKNQASEPDKVAALIQIISENLGYALYRAVESTKVELTENETAEFVFAHGRANIEDTLERWRFESWIQEDVQNIATCVKRLFSAHNVSYADIGSVFLTGGSSFVPYVRRFFARTFGGDKLKGGEELTTVAKGLALRALENG
jgi:molecular chaperone DnaK (HSP70)